MSWKRSELIALGSFVTALGGLFLSNNELRCFIGLPSEFCNPCVSVNSREEWQNFDLEGSYKKITSINGSWSVDDKKLPRVGASGHSKTDEEIIGVYKDLKFDPRFRFGALLMNSSNPEWIQGPMSFPNSVDALDLRINDADDVLRDNEGFLEVCFGK